MGPKPDLQSTAVACNAQIASDHWPFSLPPKTVRSAEALDVLGYLAAAERSGTLVLTVPWVVEYLKLLELDPISRKSRYFQAVLGKLDRMRRGWSAEGGRAAELNYNRLCVIAVLEE